ncbi:MAG: hypothetical protein KJZ69_05205 [Phycisphaerales bacterium]|nr:hypothetical protein [Phycisphaerales bacterium]
MHWNGGPKVHEIMRVALAVLTALLCCSTFATAQDEDTSNAATWYRRAYERLGGITPEQWTLIIEYQKVGGPPPAGVREVLRRYQPAIADLHRAAGLARSDFGLHYSQGVYMTMPHINGVRNLLRLTAADAAMRLADGDGAGAAAEIISLQRLGDHLSDDRIMMSSIFSSFMLQYTDGLMSSGFDAAVFGEAESAALLGSLRSFDASDPIGAVDALAGEQFIAMQTLREALESDDQAGFARFAEIFGLNEERAAVFQNMGPDALQAELDSYGAVMDRFVAAFGSEDAEAARAEMASLSQACMRGEFGNIAAILAPGLENCYGPLDHTRELLANRVESFEKILGGEVSAAELANAAVWYRRGIDRMSSLDEAWKQALAALDPAQPLSQEAIDALAPGAEDAAAAIEQFMHGSGIRRCDFSPGRDPREVFIPLYADGMRDGFRLLALESLRTEAAGDGPAAAAALSAAIRMAAHLSDDRILVSSLIAHGGFRLALQTAHAQDGRAPFAPKPLAEFSAALRRCGAGDPFGYIAAAAESRQAVRARLLEWVILTDRPALSKPLDAWLAGIDADGLAYLLAMQDQMEYGYQPREPFHRAGAERLSESLLAETIDLAAIDAPAFADLIKQRRAEEYTLPETIVILGASERMASARRDLWEALEWLRRREAATVRPEEP